MTRGRPLGFLAVIVLGWVGTRTVMLWPDPAVSLVATRSAPRHDSFPPFERAQMLQAASATVPANAQASAWPGLRRPGRYSQRLNDAQILALYGLRYFVEMREPQPGLAALTVVSPLLPDRPADAVAAAVSSAGPAPSRWSVAAWLSAREGRADPRLTPLLGASQAGGRVSYALSGDRRAAVFARAAAPLGGGGAEVAAGLQWRPGGTPVTAFVEARHRAGMGVAAAIGVFGGGAIALPDDFRLDTYGQAGWVGGRDATGFVEGQARAARTVVRSGGAALEVGAGVWGAAQRGAARLDVGPGAGFTVPLGRASVRLELDWRQRIAGRAAPGSGAVLTLGGGF